MRITVYTQPNCVQCDQTKKWLAKHDIPFEVGSVTDETAVAVAKENGFLAAPIVVAGDKAWSGFRLEKLKHLAILLKGE